MTGLSGIDKILGTAIENSLLLKQALTHKSKSSGVSECYDRLEFLGDAVLDLVAREFLLLKYPGEDEGLLTRRKVKMVCRENLVKQGRRLNLLRYIKFADDVGKFSERTLDSVVADVVESLIGALYIDKGLDAARRFIKLELLEPASDIESGAKRDPRTALQEYCQGLNYELPVYELISKRGPEHKPLFAVTVTLSNGISADGTGETMKDAIRESAMNALKIIEKKG